MPFVFKDGSEAGICKTCGEPAWSIRSNRCEQHRIEPATKLKVEPPKGSTPLAEDPSIVSQIVDVGKVDKRTFGSKAPTASEWEEKLTTLAVLVTMLYVEYAVVKPLKIEEPHATEFVAQLGMSDEEARTIVEPLSYLLHKSTLNKKYGREAIEILAFAPALLAVLEWQQRVAKFRVEMSGQVAAPAAPFLVGGTDVVAESPEVAPGAGGPAVFDHGGPPVANFERTARFDPNQAPTARVDGRRRVVDGSR